MAWDREKWQQFIADNRIVLPTDAAANAAAAEAKALADTYEEDVDLDALGTSRVKTMLEELAAVTPGPTGPAGPAGTLNPNAVNGPASGGSDIVSTTTKHHFTNPAAPGGTSSETITLMTFAQGDLDGAEDVIIIAGSIYNVSGVIVYWTPTNIGPGSVPRILWEDGVVPALGDGYLGVHVVEAPDPTNSNLRSIAGGVAFCNGSGVGTLRQMTWNDATPITGWMAIGGIITVTITSTTASTFGIMI